MPDSPEIDLHETRSGRRSAGAGETLDVDRRRQRVRLPPAAPVTVCCLNCTFSAMPSETFMST